MWVGTIHPRQSREPDLRASSQRRAKSTLLRPSDTKQTYSYAITPRNAYRGRIDRSKNLPRRANKREKIFGLRECWFVLNNKIVKNPQIESVFINRKTVKLYRNSHVDTRYSRDCIVL